MGVYEEQFQARLRQYKAQQMERQHMQEYVDRFYNEKRSSAQAARVKQALSKKKALEKMELLIDPNTEIDEERLTLRFPDPGLFKKRILIQAENLSFGYDDSKPILKD